MGFLTDTSTEIRREREGRPLDDAALMARSISRAPARGFADALRARAPAVIAEVKRSSPSAGVLATEADPTERARAYAGAGAAAISVLTDAPHFGGSVGDLQAVRIATELPILRKDFMVHPSQVIEARAFGADAVLLIAAILSADELAAMLATARDLGMDALVEAHAEEDLERAIASGAEVIGVNARDLETLKVDLAGALARLPLIPRDRVAVLESGVSTRSQVSAAVDAGASAVLVGDALMRAHDPVAKLRELIGDGVAT